MQSEGKSTVRNEGYQKANDPYFNIAEPSLHS